MDLLTAIAFDTIFGPNRPLVEVCDVQSNVADLTTYTFPACNLGNMGSDRSMFGTYGTDAHIRSPGRRLFFVIVHSEDAATAWTVSNVTIGGVAGFTCVDGAGVTTVSTAIWHWSAEMLDGITNTDVAVTFSEAVTACAIGIISVSNMGVLQRFRTNFASGTGTMVMGSDSTIVNHDIGALSLWGTTCSASAQQMQFADMGPGGGLSGARPPELLYELSTAEMSVGAIWQYCPQYNGDNGWAGGIQLDWTGVGTCDIVGVHYV